MRINSANRSFYALVGLVLVPYALLGLAGCGLLSVVVYRLASHGWSGLQRGGDDLRPAAMFFALVTSGTVIAALSVRRQVGATRRLARVVASQSGEVPERLSRAAAHVGLAGRVDLWEEAQPCSFTYGLSSPRVAVSRGLADALGEAELEAVLHHERYHVRNRDTLKVVVARAAPSAFFFLPALRALRDRYLATRELAADRRAVRALGVTPIASALFTVLEGPAVPDLGAAAALGGSAFLDQRIEQLEQGSAPPPAPLGGATVLGTAAGLVVLTGALLLTLANGGANAVQMDDSMLDRGGIGVALSALGWVFCAGAWVAAGVLLVRRARRHARIA